MSVRVRSDCDLPTGWKRVEQVKRNGVAMGRIEIYYQSPDGTKFHTKSELSKALSKLGEQLDLFGFDFKSGRFKAAALKARRYRGIDHTKACYDNVLHGPVRQTASIMRHPVQVFRNHPESRTRTDIVWNREGVNVTEKRRQLFWMKRLENLYAIDDSGKKSTALLSVPQIQGVGVDLAQSSLLQCIGSMLHSASVKVVGQSSPKQLIEKNPTVNIDPSQPFVMPLSITEHVLHRQEGRMNDVRNRLKNALSNLDQAENQLEEYQCEDSQESDKLDTVVDVIPDDNEHDGADENKAENIETKHQMKTDE